MVHASVSQDRPTVQLFTTDQQALEAIRALTRAGVSPDDISVLARSSAEADRLHDETGASEDLEAGVNRDTGRDILDVLGSLESLLVPGLGACSSQATSSSTFAGSSMTSVIQAGCRARSPDRESPVRRRTRSSMPWRTVRSWSSAARRERALRPKAGGRPPHQVGH